MRGELSGHGRVSIDSRHADLGNAAFLYPPAAIGGALLSLAAIVGFRQDRGVPRSAWLPIYLAAGMALGGLLATIRAARNMLSLTHLDDDTMSLQNAFDGFERWGVVRAVFQILAFGANV